MVRIEGGWMVAAVLLAVTGCTGGGTDHISDVPAAASVSVAVAPADLIMAAGAQTTFTAAVTGAADASVSWSVLEGNAGGYIDPRGVYVAPLVPGTYHVVATSNADAGRNAVAVVTVSADATTTGVAITIAPTAVVVPAGAQQAFTCGITGTTDRTCTYAVQEGATGGTIDEAGRYTAPATPGTYHVVATSHADGTKRVVAVALVTDHLAAAGVSVDVAPTSVGLLTGFKQSFSCSVTGASDGSCLFAVQEGDAGGLIDGTGTYTAPNTPGTYHVVATSRADPGKIAVATVLVSEDPTAAGDAPRISVAISPSSVAVAAGSLQAFTCTVTRSTDTACVWSVREGTAGGTVDGTGRYVAPSAPGTYHVVATSHADSNRRATATVTVTAATASASSAAGVAVSLTPASVSLATNASQSFACAITGSTDTSCTWSVQEGSGGSISSAGAYTAPAAAGTYHVVATSHADSSKQATSTVTVSAPPPPISVATSPTSVSLSTGATQPFTCVVAGSPDTACTWSLQEGSAGGTISSAGVYMAPATPGTYHVISASHADPTKTATASVTVSAPQGSISIAPSSVSVSACQSVTLTATISGTTSQAVTWSIQEGSAGGSITAQGVYTAPSTAGTYHAIATSQADGTKSATAAIVVSDKVVAVSVTPASVTTQPGQTVQFTATVTTTCGTFASSTIVGS